MFYLPLFSFNGIGSSACYRISIIFTVIYDVVLIMVFNRVITIHPSVMMKDPLIKWFYRFSVRVIMFKFSTLVKNTLISGVSLNLPTIQTLSARWPLLFTLAKLALITWTIILLPQIIVPQSLEILQFFHEIL